MTLTSSTRITLTASMTEQITDLLTVIDYLLHASSEQTRTELGQALQACDYDTVNISLFTDLVGFTARHLDQQLHRARRDTCQGHRAHHADEPTQHAAISEGARP